MRGITKSEASSEHSFCRGPCWARCEAQRLWRGEEYHLAIDSHMRFVQNWDTLLLSLLASCPTQKAVLTSYPPPYELPDKLCDDKRPPLFVATSFDSDGMLRLSGRTLASSPLASVPLPTLFWAAGFNFASSKVLAYGCTRTHRYSPLGHTQRGALRSKLRVFVLWGRNFHGCSTMDRWLGLLCTPYAHSVCCQTAH